MRHRILYGCRNIDDRFVVSSLSAAIHPVLHYKLPLHNPLLFHEKLSGLYSKCEVPICLVCQLFNSNFAPSTGNLS